MNGYGFGLQPADSNMASHERISQLVSAELSFSVQIEPNHHSLLRIISKVKEALSSGYISSMQTSKQGLVSYMFLWLIYHELSDFLISELTCIMTSRTCIFI